MRKILFLLISFFKLMLIFVILSELTKSNQSKLIVNKELVRIDKENSAIINESEEYVTKAFVYLKDRDSTIRLYYVQHQDHRIFGYSKPDVKSERLILFSVFTNDVLNNPFGCKLGAYYECDESIGIKLKYISTNNNFIKASALDSLNNFTILYFEKKWIDLE